MSEQQRIVPVTLSKVSNPEIIQQILGNTNSTKMLSPFTWSHLHIKLPKLPVNQGKQQQYGTITQREQKNTEGSKQKRKLKKKSIDHQKIKLQAINKTIHVQTHLKKQTQSQNRNNQDKGYHRYRKESVDNVHESVNLDFNQKYIRHNPDNLRQYKRDLITRHLQKVANRNQSPTQNILNRTSADFSRIRSPMSVFSSKTNVCTPQTFCYNKIQNYIYKALIKSNWCQVPQKGPPLPELIWSDHYLQSSTIKQPQIHNHINNSHFLTTKNNLHELQSAIGSQHYPISFIMPFQYENFCEEYEQNIVKICLKDIMRKAYPKLVQNNVSYKGGLAALLQGLKNKNNISDQTFMTVKLCLYLENYRKIKNYRHLENSQQYVPIQTNLQLSVLSTILKACYEYQQSLVKQFSTETHNSPFFNPSQMSADILHILHSYHKMLLKNEPSYQNLSIRNQWIVKPIASSRGAGISLLKNSQEFFSINHDRFQFSNKTKFGNKIIQKYVEQPLLISKKGPFEGRKFDIRQWVLVTCDSQSLQPLIYVFEDAYCRFSDMKFTYNYYRSQQTKIHLTNYSVSDKSNPSNSLLLFSELISDYMPSLSKLYRPQLTKIIVQTILNCQDLKFQPNRFQLLGYDLIFDQYEKLWLLEINLNPACEATRSQKLQNIADKMIHGMMKIVKGASGKSVILGKEREKLGWDLIYGKERFRQVELEDVQNQSKIKPFYALSLGSQSLVEEVRKRSIMMNAILKTVSRFNLRDIWKTLFSHKGFKAQQQEEKKQENVQPELNQKIKQQQIFQPS